MKISYKSAGIALLLAFPFLGSAATTSDIPLTFNDAVFSGVTNSGSVNLPNGGMLSNKSITVNGSTKFNMTEYKVTPPTVMMGTIKTGDAVTVEYSGKLMPK